MDGWMGGEGRGRWGVVGVGVDNIKHVGTCVFMFRRGLRRETNNQRRQSSASLVIFLEIYFITSGQATPTLCGSCSRMDGRSSSPASGLLPKKPISLRDSRVDTRAYT